MWCKRSLQQQQTWQGTMLPRICCICCACAQGHTAGCRRTIHNCRHTLQPQTADVLMQPHTAAAQFTDVLMQTRIASKHMQGWAQPEGEPGWGWHPRLTVRVNGQPRGSFVACTSSSEGEAGAKEGSSRVEFHGAVPILAEVSPRTRTQACLSPILADLAVATPSLRATTANANGCPGLHS